MDTPRKRNFSGDTCLLSPTRNTASRKVHLSEDVLCSVSPKRKQLDLTLGQKIDVIKEYEKSPKISQIKLVEKYKIRKSTVGDILKKEQNYLYLFEHNASADRKRTTYTSTCVSSGIGIYYGCFKKQKTTEEYILGNRQIHFIPVAFSLAVTFQSAGSIIGLPSEVYLFNIMVLYISIGIAIANLLQAFVIVPLVHPLNLTSAYEYLQRRFRSRAIQLLGMTMGMLQTLLYVSIVLYSPALAFEAVAGIPVWLSIVLIGILGTVYTSIGGMRTVIWTDTFQFIMLYGGLTVILVLGVKEIGSFSRVFDLSIKGDRMKYNEIRIDPRVRHTVWGCVIGGVFNWLPNCCNQSAIQRICSIHTARDAKISSLLNVPLYIIFDFALLLTGLVLYEYFVIKECDPLASGELSNPNQLMIYFVMNVLNDVPGLAGVFLAAVFSGALSSLSSGINSMAANTMQDILANHLKETMQVKKTLIAKIIVLLYGILTVTLAYLAQNLTVPVTQIGQTAFGAAGGPVVGIFFLGAVFPQANKKGALAGGIVSIAFNMWIALGSFIYGRKPPLSMPIPINGCFQNETVLRELNVTKTTALDFVSTASPNWNITTDHRRQLNFSSNLSADEEHIVLYDLSYMWLGLIGFLTTITIGLVVSLLTGKDKDHPTEPIYIAPFLRQVWTFDKSTLHVRINAENSLISIEEEVEVDDTTLDILAVPLNEASEERLNTQKYNFYHF